MKFFEAFSEIGLRALDAGFRLHGFTSTVEVLCDVIRARLGVMQEGLWTNCHMRL